MSPDQLARARWHHEVGPSGNHTEVCLPDGRFLLSAAIGAVFNRADTLLPVGFERAPERDGDYAGAELLALFVSWLQGLDRPLVNPVDGNGPVGRWTPRRWLLVARRFGLPIASSLAATSNRAVPAGVRSGVVPSMVGPLGDVGPVSRSWPSGLGDGVVLATGGRSSGPLASRFGAQCVAASREVGCPLAAFRFAAGPEPALIDVDTSPSLDESAQQLAVADLLERAAQGDVWT